MDDFTILMRFFVEGDTALIEALRRVSTQLQQEAEFANKVKEAQRQLVKETGSLALGKAKLADVIKLLKKNLNDEQREISEINAELSRQNSESLKAAEAEQKLAQAEKERQRVLNILHAENERYNASLSRQDATVLKLRADYQALTSTALGRFSVGMAGGIEKMRTMETTAYNASRQMAFFSQQLALHPIRTLKAFTQSTEKAAIAAAYFREQLAFVAASRFGAIMILFGIMNVIEQAISRATEALKEFDQSMRNIARHLAAEGMGAKEAQAQATALTKEIQNLSLWLGVSLQNLGIMAERLKAAGLSMQDVKDSIGAFGQFMVAYPEVETNNFTKAIIGLMNATKDMKGFRELSSDAERLKKLLNELSIAAASAVYEPKDIPVFVSHLTTLSTVSGILPEQMLALEGTLTALGQKASVAGRLMRGLLVTLSQPKKIEVLEKMGVYIDHTKTLGDQFNNIVEQIAKLSKMSMAGALDVNSMKQLAAVIPAQRMSVLAALMKDANDGWRIYNDQLKEIQNSSGAVDRAAKMMNESIDSQKTILQNTVNAILQNIAGGADLAGTYRDLAVIVKVLGTALLIVKEGFMQIWIAAKGAATQMLALYMAIGRAMTGDFKGAIEDLKVFRDIGLETFEQMGKSGQATHDVLKNMWVYPESLAKKQVSDQERLAEFNKQINQAISERAVNYKDLLTEEAKYQIQVRDGLSAEKQIAHWKKVESDLITELTAKAQQGTLDFKEQEELSKQIVKAHDKLLDAQEKQTKELEKQKAKYQTNLDALSDVVKGFTKIKQLTPLTEMQENNVALEMAVQRISQAKIGSTEWNRAIKDIGKETVTIANHYDLVLKQIDKALQQTNSLVGQSIQFAKALKESGRGWEAIGVLQEQKSALDFSLMTAMNKKQEMEIQKQILQIMEAQKESGGTYGDIERDILNKHREIHELQKNIADEEIRKAEDAKAYLDATGGARDINEVIKDQYGDVIKLLESARDELDAGLNTGLEETRKLLEDSKKVLVEIADVIRNMPQLNLGGSGEYNEEKFLEEERRG